MLNTELCLRKKPPNECQNTNLGIMQLIWNPTSFWKTAKSTLYPQRTEGTRQVPWRKPQKRVYQTLKITNGITLLLCLQKGLEETETLPRLQMPKWRNDQKCLLSAKSRQITGQAQRSQVFHKTGSPIGIQQCQNQDRWQMEGSIKNKQRALWTPGNVFLDYTTPWQPSRIWWMSYSWWKPMKDGSSSTLMTSRSLWKKKTSRN